MARRECVLFGVSVLLRRALRSGAPALLLVVAAAASISADASEVRGTVSRVTFPASLDLPNPRSPFWLGVDHLGFVTERLPAKQTRTGGLFLYDFRMKSIRQVLQRPVLFPTFLRAERRISFVDIGTTGSLAFFTVSLMGEDPIELNFRGTGAFDPSWSPDSRRMVFADLSYDANLVVADVSTGAVRALGNLGRGVETEGAGAPDWSPDGSAIVYVGYDKSSRTPEGNYQPTISRLYVFDIHTGSYRRLTGGRFKDLHPAYSPDGRHVAFVSNRSRQWELWVVGSDGTGLRQLTNMARQGLAVGPEKPAWSPDQQRIAFSAAPLLRESEWPLNHSGLFLLEFRQAIER